MATLSPLVQLSKPIVGQRIDPTHPLASGLRVLAPLWEGSGASAFDVAGGQALAFANGAAWSSGQFGKSVLCTATGAGAYALGLPPWLQLNYPMSIAMRVRWTGTTPGNFNHLSRFSSSNTQPVAQIRWQSTTPVISVSSVAGAVTTSYTMVSKAWTTLVLAVTTGGKKLYADGVLVYSDSTSNSQPTYNAAQSFFGLGGNPVLSSASSVAEFDYLAAWDRELVSNDALGLTQNPWQLIQSPVRAAVFFPSTTNASSSPTSLIGSGTIGTPAYSLGAGTSPSSLIGSGTLSTVTVAAAANASASPSSLIGSGTLSTATIVLDWVQSPTSLIGSGTLPAGLSVALGSTISPSSLSGTGTITDPSISAGGSISVSATSLIGAGTLSAASALFGSTISPSSLVGSGVIAAGTSAEGEDGSTDVAFAVSSLAATGTIAAGTSGSGNADDQVHVSFAVASLAGHGAIGSPDVFPSRMFRERDVRQAMREILEATGEFDAVYLGSLPDRKGRSAADTLAIAIEPANTRESDSVSAAPTGRIDLTATVRLTVMAREEDEDVRDSEAERLIHVASNALSGKSLAGLTMPQFTRTQGWDWLPTTSPERRIRATFGFRYLISSWQSFNTDR